VPAPERRLGARHPGFNKRTTRLLCRKQDEAGGLCHQPIGVLPSLAVAVDVDSVAMVDISCSRSSLRRLEHGIQVPLEKVALLGITAAAGLR
jgi:hypothetical protein